jgi:hypothetical protein
LLDFYSPQKGLQSVRIHRFPILFLRSLAICVNCVISVAICVLLFLGDPE